MGVRMLGNGDWELVGGFYEFYSWIMSKYLNANTELNGESRPHRHLRLQGRSESWRWHDRFQRSSEGQEEPQNSVVVIRDICTDVEYKTAFSL